MTIGERLQQLSGMSGATVGQMIAAIGSGSTVGQRLANYSGLATGTVGQHLFTDHTGFGGSCNYIQFARRSGRR